MKYELEIPFGKLVAKSYRDFLAQVEVERDFWLEFRVDRPLSLFQNDSSIEISNSVSSLMQEMSEFWGGIVSHLEDLDGRSFSQNFEQIRALVSNASTVPPYSASRISLCAMSLLRDGKKIEAFAIICGAHHLKEKVVSNGNAGIDRSSFHSFARSAALSVLVANSAVKADALGEIETYKNVAAKISQELGLMVQDLQSANETALKTSEQTQKYNTEKFYLLRRTLVKGMRRNRKQYNAMLLKEKTRFEGLFETYNKKLGLEHPVNLWTERAKDHSENSIFAFKCFIGGAILFAIFASIVSLFFGHEIAAAFTPESCVQGTEPSCGRISPRGPLIISTLLLVSTVSLWFLRLQMKIYLSERHLSLDANERRAFAETYLALLNGQYVTSEHELVLLQSLFRPTQDGIIKDESGPDFGLAGILAKTLEKQR